MSLRISFVGPAAPGLAEGRDPTAVDLLDLQDERIYLTRWPDDPYELQFAGIIALISCCGAWPGEIVELETTDLRLKNLPAGKQPAVKSGGADAAHPADNGIWLGSGDYRRRVWVPEVARMTLARVTGRITPVDECTRLFMRRNGTPMSVSDIRIKLFGLSIRIGLGKGGIGLTPRLLAFFEDCMSMCGDDLATAFLCRRVVAMRQAREPGGAGEPTLARLRKAIESNHPLGRLTREMLQHVRPLERAHPERGFRVLSPQAAADVAAVRKEPRKYCYPREVVEAVLAAVDAGRHEREIAAHYGIPTRTISYWLSERNNAGFGRYRDGMAPGAHKAAFLTHARRHPEKSVDEVNAWMKQRLGVVTKKQNLQQIARREGVKLANPRWNLRSSRDRMRLEAHMRKHPKQTVLDVQAWARQALGREIPYSVLYDFADLRGLGLSTCFKLSGANAAALVAFVRANGDADIHEVVAWIEKDLKMIVALGTVRAFLWRRGLKTRKLPTGNKAPYEAAFLAWLSAHPDAEVAEALAWLKAELGKPMRLNTLHSFLSTHGIKLRRSKGGTKAPYGPALLAWLRAHPDADIDEVLAWLQAELGTSLRPNTLRSFLRNRGIKLRSKKT